MRRNIFIDENLDDEFHSEGFVMIPFLDHEEVETCRNLFLSLPPASSEIFYTSHLNRDEAYRRTVHEKLQPILARKAEKFLNQYESFYNYFLVKNPGEGSSVRLHQDWTLVDEDYFTSLIFWCPLADTNEENGLFKVVKKSHLFMKNARGTGIEPGYTSIMDQVERDFLTTVSVPAGMAIAFDLRLLHASGQNNSGISRVAVGTVLRPIETKFIHLADKPESNKYEMFEGNDDFLLKFTFWDDPRTCLVKTGREREKNRILTIQEFSNLYWQYSES